MKRYQKSGKWRAQTDIQALEKAGKDAAQLQKNIDEDWSRIGRVIKGIVDKLLERHEEQKQMEEESINKSRQKKRGFYTSAEASAKDD